jgi:pyruvate dehydrogenase E1 component alpha subunit
MWQKRDPLIRTRRFLESRGLWDDAQQKKTEALAKARIQDVIQASINFPKPNVDDIFDYVYEALPAELARQKQTLRTDSIGQDPEQIGLKSSPEPHSV